MRGLLLPRAGQRDSGAGVTRPRRAFGAGWSRIEGTVSLAAETWPVVELPPLFGHSARYPRCALACTPVLPTTSRSRWTGALTDIGLLMGYERRKI